jgi:hypothetical protein
MICESTPVYQPHIMLAAAKTKAASPAARANRKLLGEQKIADNPQ